MLLYDDKIVDNLTSLFYDYGLNIDGPHNKVIKGLAVLHNEIINLRDRVDTLEYEKRQLEYKVYHIESKLD